jgi:hypothetical protein
VRLKFASLILILIIHDPQIFFLSMIEGQFNNYKFFVPAVDFGVSAKK